MSFRELTCEHVVTYDSEVDAAYLQLTDHLPDGAAVRQEVVPLDDVGEVILDLDASGRLLGVEVLSASQLLPASLLRRLGSDVRQ